MIKFNKPILFFLFAGSLFLLGIAISDVIVDGFKEGNKLFFQLGSIFLYASLGFTFYNNLYRKWKP